MSKENRIRKRLCTNYQIWCIILVKRLICAEQTCFFLIGCIDISHIRATDCLLWWMFLKCNSSDISLFLWIWCIFCIFTLQVANRYFFVKSFNFKLPCRINVSAKNDKKNLYQYTPVSYSNSTQYSNFVLVWIKQLTK